MRKLLDVLAALLAALLVALAIQSPASAAKDKDRDGLPNKWEKGKTPKGLNLKRLKANPHHKDVFLELTYSTRSGPDKISCAALDALYGAFKNAPVTNPDGKTGINLHLDAGRTCPSRSYDIKKGNRRFTVASACASPLDSANSMAEKRLSVFHMGAVVADSELCGPEGQAGANDFMVKDQQGTFFFAYVVMHELGHVFGLDHGPFNGFSVMSGGAFTFGDNSGTPAIDFLRYPVNALNEAALDESKGYTSTSSAGNSWLAKWYAPQKCASDSVTYMASAGGPVDWNCSGAPFWVPPYSSYIDPGTVAYDVNNDGVIGTVAGVAAEWPRVDLRSPRIGK